MVEQLQEAGFDTLKKIAEAMTEGLTQVKGLGKIKAQKMIDEAKKILKE